MRESGGIGLMMEGWTVGGWIDELLKEILGGLLDGLTNGRINGMID